MDKDYIINNYEFKKITNKHDLSEFLCDSDDLNDFIKNDALNQQNDNLNITKLICCNNEIIGFFSLLADSIELKHVRDKKTKESIKNHLPKVKKMPAIKICRFAINKKYSNKGIGSHIMRNVIFNIKTIAEKDIGLRFVTIEAYAKAYEFYTKYNNFLNLIKDDKKLKRLDKIIKINPEHKFYLYQDINKLKD